MIYLQKKLDWVPKILLSSLRLILAQILGPLNASWAGQQYKLKWDLSAKESFFLFNRLLHNKSDLFQKIKIGTKLNSTFKIASVKKMEITGNSSIN